MSEFSHSFTSKNKPGFSLGQTYFTKNAFGTLDHADAFAALQRHGCGDWGECGEEDWQSNEEALFNEDRLFSVYRDRNDRRFWIITEADRSGTTILLPEDY